MPQPYQEYLDKILISEDKLQSRIRELAAEINRDYAGKELLVICILRGGVMFMTDLIRHIDVPLAIEFMAVSSYGTGARSSQGDVRITLDLNTNIKGRHVVIVEDIIDSGHTLSSVIGTYVLCAADRKFMWIAAPLAALIAFSRLYLFVHFPTDVLAAVVLGLLIGATAVTVCRRTKKE